MRYEQSIRHALDSPDDVLSYLIIRTIGGLEEKIHALEDRVDNLLQELAEARKQANDTNY